MPFAEQYGFTPRDIDQFTLDEFSVYVEGVKRARQQQARRAGRRG